MSGWVLTKGLENLRSQVNEAFPDRDKTTDGTIGDEAHQQHVSGHNPDDTRRSKPAWDGDPDTIPEVRAWDMDKDLNFPGVSTQDLVDWICLLPNLGSVIRYMIYNGKEYHVDNKFKPTNYTGSNPHTDHVHFEGAWTQSADNNTTFNYRLEMYTMATVTDIAHAVVLELQNGGLDAAKLRQLSGDGKTNLGLNRTLGGNEDSMVRIILQMEDTLEAIQATLADIKGVLG